MHRKGVPTGYTSAAPIIRRARALEQNKLEDKESGYLKFETLDPTWGCNSLQERNLQGKTLPTGLVMKRLVHFRVED